MFSSWTAPSCICSKSDSSETLRLRALRELLAAETLGALLGEVLRLALVLDDATELAGGRRTVEAEDLHRVTGAGLLDLLAAVVVERAHLARRRHRRRSRLRRAACRAARASWRRGRARCRVATRRSGRRPSAFGFARRSSSASATSRMRSRRSSRFVFCFADTSENCVDPPHSSGCSPSAASSLLTLSALASGTSILFTATTIGTSGRARVRDRLARLRHHAVVGGDDQHGDVGHLGAAGAHGREGLVARRVEEGDLAAVDVGLVGADVLGDAAGLGRRRRRVERIASSSVVLP